MTIFSSFEIENTKYNYREGCPSPDGVYSLDVANKTWVFVDDIPTDVQTEVDKLLVIKAINAYKELRQAEYPSLLELTVALYDTDDKSAVEAKRAAVKAKYPKPS